MSSGGRSGVRGEAGVEVDMGEIVESVSGSEGGIGRMKRSISR